MILDLVLYYGIVIIPTYILYKARNSNEKRRKYRISVILACLIPSFFFGIRYNVGTDWITYNNHYRWISQGVLLSWIEPGYYFLALLCNNIGLSFYAFSFICCYLMEASILKALKNFELQKVQWLGYFLAAFSLYFVAYNIMRQMIATSFVILSYSYYKIKKKKKAFIWLLLAISFHKSAVLGIMPIVISNAYNRLSLLSKSKTFLMSFFLSCFGVVIAVPIIIKIRSLGFYKSEKYAIHAFDVRNLRFLVYYIPEWILVYLFMRRNRSARLYECYSVFMLGALFQFIACVFPSVDRLSWYFVSFRILLYPMMVLELTSAMKRQFCAVSIIWFLIYFFVMCYILPGDKLFPYTTIFG